MSFCVLLVQTMITDVEVSAFSECFLFVYSFFFSKYISSHSNLHVDFDRLLPRERSSFSFISVFIFSIRNNKIERLLFRKKKLLLFFAITILSWLHSEQKGGIQMEILQSQSVDCKLLQNLSVCVTVCLSVCPAFTAYISLTMGRILIKLNEKCLNFSPKQSVKGVKKNFFAFLCVSEHFESIETLFIENFRECEAQNARE